MLRLGETPDSTKMKVKEKKKNCLNETKEFKKTQKCHLIETITILNVCTSYEIPWSY